MRKISLKRKTKETQINLNLKIDGKGRYKVSTGIAFLDHMLSLFSRHGLFDLELKVKGDLEIDFHHTNEDIGIALGGAFRRALSDKRGIKRFGWALVVLDEAQVKAVVDLSGRPFLDIIPKNVRGGSGGYNFKYFKEFLRSFVNNSFITLHIDILKGEDFHHILECAFKALGLALREAASLDKRRRGLPTTKGKL